MKHRVRNRLSEIRKSRGLTAAELAARVGVNRQTVYAIESGTYLPNTELSLLLAELLEVGVEEIFSLAPARDEEPELLPSRFLSAEAPVNGLPVRICRVGQEWVSVPVGAAPYYMPEADGLVAGVAARRLKHEAGARLAGAQLARAQLMVFGRGEELHKRLLLAGCDPATSLLSRMVERAAGVEIVPAAASSKRALAWLKEGKVHIAGSHLEDPRTGEFNLPYIRRQFPGEELVVVTFAHWEEGFVVAPGNPKGIGKVEDLARRGVSFINREPGAGSRALLDKLAAAAGLGPERIHGYERIAQGHLAAAFAVCEGSADACLATRSAARAFALDFVPLHGARYDFVMRKETADLPLVQSFLDVLQRASLRRKLEAMAGYDTTSTGARLAA